MIGNLEKIIEEYEELEKRLSEPAMLEDQQQFQQLARRHAELHPLVNKYEDYLAEKKKMKEAEELLGEGEPELEELARAEIADHQQRLEELEGELRLLLIPKDPDVEKNAIVEIRAGTGGEEAALFARDLFRMYSRFAEKRGWRAEVLDSHYTGLGGIKEIVFAVEGKGAFGVLSFESGVHRVQRVPETESSGRIHTSAATVAVLPEAQEVDVKIAPDDLRIETFRAGGPGGQHVQKNLTAVRITHLPTGLVVSCQDERSQLQNKQRALRILRSQLLERERQQRESEISAARRRQIKSGDRSEKVRTYNFPQGRVTDHRINFSLFSLGEFLEGEIEEMLEALQRAEDEAQLRV